MYTCVSYREEYDKEKLHCISVGPVMPGTNPESNEGHLVSGHLEKPGPRR